MKTRFASIVAVVLFSGCGDGSGAGQPDGSTNTLTCAWLQGENCWTQLLASVSQCVDPGMGALATDRSSCSYASGKTVTFATAVPVDVTSYSWDFEVRSGSSLCVGLHEVGKNFTVDSSANTFTYESVGTSGIRITCPDGSRFEASDALALLGTCGTTGFPVRTYAGNATSVQYSLGVTGDDARTVSLLNCRAP